MKPVGTASELIIWTYDWVPPGPRGFVRDVRLRWACEEADLDYTVRTVPFDGRETNHIARQPFGQVPFLNDGDLEMFESGAALLAFKKAHAEQVAFFEEADQRRTARGQTNNE